MVCWTGCLSICSAWDIWKWSRLPGSRLPTIAPRPQSALQKAPQSSGSCAHNDSDPHPTRNETISLGSLQF